MAAPPLSGCPLKRLEIHGGPTCNTYDAASLESSLTATLDAQRSTTGSHSNLLLQSHLGMRRVFSMQLEDLTASPGSEREIVETYQPSLRIRIQFFCTAQTVIFYFEKEQDFGHAIIMLKRIGFRVQDGVPLQLHTCATTKLDPVSSNHFGPRLSSFTPLRNEGQQLSQTHFSFTSMLNSDVPLTQLLPPDTQGQCIHQPLPYDISQEPDLQSSPVPAYAPHISPQHVHLNQRKNTYQPRISSPLRHTIRINDQSEANSLSLPNSQPIPDTDHAEITSFPSHRGISAPKLLSNFLQFPQVAVTNYNASPDYQFSPSGSQESNTSAESCSQTTAATDDDLNLQLGQDFRKLMPRTRSLPFLKGRDHTVAQLKPRNKSDQRHNNSCEKETVPENANVFKKEKAKVLKSNSISSQLVFRCTPPQSKALQSGDTPTCRPSFEVAELPTMLITDPALLERANKATSQLLDQYRTDVNRGSNTAAYAEFYLGRLQAVRREFWFNELNQMDESGSGNLY
ncbi:hypothetical protein M441DRAFT_28606 [Trichoderma asperellum CBS 433.97]|uniref:Uncharacterized protein n=1 Tax=Trichoderma asperellum (strain ATCC 204424 / CBS 433.97 / NBRC 101777) TaxID=1042311 RepID=A0A2T3Z3S9_TRIA4|nr:hypothetical protein M441DRAFT_28606 [Trichoderma asperellum CBS 433.97]PTB39478.1 hypothetical protein M441DRAFT_28606 [Trichoderma asperellum CBS 433.97]